MPGPWQGRRWLFYRYMASFFVGNHKKEAGFDVNPMPLSGSYQALRPFPPFWALARQGPLLGRCYILNFNSLRFMTCSWSFGGPRPSKVSSVTNVPFLQLGQRRCTDFSGTTRVSVCTKFLSASCRCNSGNLSFFQLLLKNP